jgi:seryl-tRNA synthetase
MLDIRRLRAETDAVRAALAKRDPELAAAVDRVLERDSARREALTRVNDLKAQRNEASKRVGELKRAGESADELIASTKRLGDEISALDDVVRAADEEVAELLLVIPNTPLEGVPVGGEEAGKVISESGPGVALDFEPRPHWELGERLGILDLAAGARISGSGFPVLRGMGARLQRSLINYFLDVHTAENGYAELRVPYLVTRETLTGTGQLPKFAEDSYQTSATTSGSFRPQRCPSRTCIATSCSGSRTCRSATRRTRPASAARRARPGRTRGGCCACISSTRSSSSATSARAERSRRSRS